MQKYNGNNPYDNRVVVDFENQKVLFEPVGAKGVIRQYYTFFNGLLLSSMIFSVYAYFIIYGILSFFGYNPVSGVYFQLLFIMIVFAISFSVIYFNKNFRHNHFPVFNYWLTGITRVMFLSPFRRKKVLTPESLFDNKAFIPDFDNVCLKYDATGDFAKYMKKISIQNLYKDNSNDWFCVFEFTKKIRTGTLELRYI